jgi:hypothetical protein
MNAPKRKRASRPLWIEIARSFSFKLNMGNYESRDFFCSQKAECRMDEADRVAEQLHAFCKSQVLKSVNDYKAECEALARAERLSVNERKAEMQAKRLQNVRPDYQNGTERA